MTLRLILIILDIVYYKTNEIKIRFFDMGMNFLDIIQRLVHLWTLDASERDAYLANEATKRWTKSNQVLVEIVCTRSAHDLLLAKQAYHTCYKKSIEEDVAYHTTGDFRKV